MHAKKAAGEIKRFPGGRKSGGRWLTPRMRELREIEAMRRVQVAREALLPPSPSPRRRGRPSNAELARRLTPELIAQAKARLAELKLALERRSLK
jgi:hypothetical protein